MSVLLLLTGALCRETALAQTGSKNSDLTLRSVPELVKLLQLGSNAQKSQAALAIGDKAFYGDTTAKEAIPALFQMIRCMTGGKPAEDAAVALAKIGTPAAELLRDEVTGAAKQSNNASRLLAIRALGLMGPAARDIAETTLTAILENPKRSLSMRNPQVNEAALALANMNIALKPNLVPDFVTAMNACKDQDAQIPIAIQLVNAPGVREKYLSDVAQVLIKASGRITLEVKIRQQVLDALVAINTPASVQAVLLVLSPPQRTMTAEDREAAVNALMRMAPPSRQALDGLINALQTERSPQVIRPICRAFCEYGPAASQAQPHLEEYLKSLPQKRNLDGGEKEKPNVARIVQKALDAMKGAAQNPLPALAAAGAKPPEPPPPVPKAAEEVKPAQDLNGQVVIALEMINKPGARGHRLAYLEALLTKALSDPSVAPELRIDILQGLVRIKTESALQAVCDILTSPQKYDSRARSAAAKALADVALPPPPQVIATLAATLKTERSVGVMTTVCRTLCAYGAAAEPAFQTLKECLRDLPNNAGLDNCEKEKPVLETVLKESINKVRQAIAEDVLNSAPPVTP